LLARTTSSRRASAHASTGVDAGASGWRRVSEINFAPGRNYHATLAETQQGPLLSVKGAPEVLLPLCERVRGSLGLLSESARQTLADEVEDALKELSSALLYSSGSLTELTDRVERFEHALEHLQTVRQDLEQSITRLQQTDSQFPSS